MQRAAGGGGGRVRADRCGRGRGDAYAIEVHGAGVAATGLMGAVRLGGGGGRLALLRGDLLLGLGRTVLGSGGLRHRGLRGGLALRGGRGGLRVAPGALGGRHQQKVVVLGSVLGGVEEGVRVRGGDARLLHHACVLRQSLARDLAGVTHAYPSPIVSAPSALRPGRRTTARRCSSSRTSGLAARHETPAGLPILAAVRRRDRLFCHGSLWTAPRCASPGLCRTTVRTKTVHFSGH